MSPLFYVFLVVVLGFFMYFQVARSKDRGQRGRVLQKLATEHLGCEFEVLPPAELRAQLEGFGLGRIRMVRNHISCRSGTIPIDILDVRYSYSAGGSARVSLSTVALFGYDGPAFRCAPNPDPQPAPEPPSSGEAGAAGGPAADAAITIDNETFNRDRILTGDNPDEIRQAMTDEFVQLATRLGDTIVASAGGRVMLYQWRTRVMPDQVPDLLKRAAEVALALGVEAD